MSVDLVLLGPPRTATTSLWTALKKHDEISTSKKELIRKVSPNKYLNQFKINENTKAILDGTPCSYHYYNELVKKLKLIYGFNVKIIYPVRNPFDRIYSTFKQNIIHHTNWNMEWGEPPKFLPFIIDKNKIDTNKILECFPVNMDSLNLQNAFDVTNDVYIFRLDEMDIKKILNFINVKQQNIILYKSNSLNNEWNECDVKNQFDNFWNNNLKEISKFIIDDLNKIQKYVNVDDWINQAKGMI